MKFGSVCSGIEAASVAWHPLGWKAAWLSEIEPFPSAVLAHHYPDVPNLGDMTTLPERILSGEVEAPDLFCGGTPCQAFSVAGLRNSLDDARGNLSLTFVGIANAIDHVRSARGEPASIVFWENVPGVLSTKDNAFGCFLAGLAGEDNPLEPTGGKWTNAGYVLGPKRAVAWRLLDAQYFGVAQRRRRVFVVASARADFDPAAVLFEFDGVRRDSAPSRETGQDPAKCITARSGNGGGFDLESETPVVANTIAARTHDAIDVQSGTFIPMPIALQEITPREKAQNGRGWNDASAAYTVDTHATQGVAQPIIGGVDYENNAHGPNDVTGPLLKGSPTGGGRPLPAIAYEVAMAFRENTRSEVQFYGEAGEVTGALTSGGGKPGQGYPAEHVNMAVRRLTPVECERLQGFPDNYTNIPWRKKDESPDGPRYKALGNSWAVPNVRWIGKRIQEALDALP
jgi:DNA (cytosine-5)-methyltransferase 1